MSYRRICLTLNNYTDADYKKLFEHAACSYGIIGKEIGEEKKTPHLQCYFELIKKTRLRKIKKHFPRGHIQPAKGTSAQNIKYCSKDGDFVEFGSPKAKKQGTRNDLAKLRQAMDEGKDDFWILQHCDAAAKYPNFIAKYQELKNRKNLPKMQLTFRPWQLRLRHLLLTPGPISTVLPPHPRKIHWYWDQAGATGKTTFSKYLVRNHGAAYFTTGKFSDLAHAYNYEPIVVFDFARTTAERTPYAILEQLKNGMLFSPKYGSITKQFEIPHIVCFANFPPVKSSLSLDRWHIVELLAGVPAV